MKSFTATIFLASISSLASASIVKSRQTTDSSVFTVIAAHSGSPIHLQTVQASNRAFWIDKNTETYCPPQVDAEGSCPPGTETVLLVGGTTASLVSNLTFGLFVLCRCCVFLPFISPSCFPRTHSAASNTDIRNGQLTYLFSRTSACPAASRSTSSPPEPWVSPRPIPRAPLPDRSLKVSRSTPAHRSDRSASPDWERRDSWPVPPTPAAVRRIRSLPTWRV